MTAMGHNRTHAWQQTSGRAFPAVSFVYLSVECPFNKFYGINCRPKLGAKLLLPVMVLTPVFGAVATASCPFCVSFSTTFDPIKPVRFPGWLRRSPQHD